MDCTATRRVMVEMRVRREVMVPETIVSTEEQVVVHAMVLCGGQ